MEAKQWPDPGKQEREQAAMHAKQKKKKRKALLQVSILLGIILLAYIGTVVYHHFTDFHYEEHLDDTALTIDGQAVSLRELGYYIDIVEEYGDEKAKLYDASNPLSYWNLHFSAGDNSSFVSEIARDTVYNTCACDYIFSAMAQQLGVSLTSDEEEQAAEAAQTFWRNLTQEQITVTGLSEALVTEIEMRRALAKKAATELVTTMDLSAFGGDPLEQLSQDGEYYKTVILPQHQIVIDEALKSNMQLGHITINMRN